MELLIRISPVCQGAMKIIKGLIFVIFILISSMAIAGSLRLGTPQEAISEPAQLLLLGVCLVGLAGYGRKRLRKG